jgi:hypothetical protein
MYDLFGQHCVRWALEGLRVMCVQNLPGFVCDDGNSKLPRVVGTSLQPMSNTLTIFDWDDTLLCTTFLQVNGIATRLDSAPDSIKEYLSSLGSRVRRLLELSIAAGQVLIITNASTGWVQETAAAYLPEVEPLLAKVNIISARDAYEHKFPGQMHMWKKAAFLELQSRFDMKSVTSLIALGDSDFEMEAAHALGSALGSAGDEQEPSPKMGRVLVKTVKFRQQPSPQELHKQIELVLQKFTKIVSSNNALTIQFKEVLNARPPHPDAACAA